MALHIRCNCVGAAENHAVVVLDTVIPAKDVRQVHNAVAEDDVQHFFGRLIHQALRLERGVIIQRRDFASVVISHRLHQEGDFIQIRIRRHSGQRHTGKPVGVDGAGIAVLRLVILRQRQHAVIHAGILHFR